MEFFGTSGPIPTELGNIVTLGSLDIGKFFSETLTFLFKKKISHRFIYELILKHFSSPLIVGNALTGPIPSEFGALTMLSDVNLGKSFLL